MKLTDLAPRFLRYEEEGGKKFFRTVPTIEESTGVGFLCPKCFQDNNGPAGTHYVICWSKTRGTPDHANPSPGRWTLVGTSLSDLTLDGESGKSRSVLIHADCHAHFYVTNGEITFT